MMKEHKAFEWMEASRFGSSPGKTISMIDPNQRYTIITDWFSAILSSDINLVAYETPLEEYIYDSGKIVFKRMRYSAPMFNFAYEIIFCGKLFGKVHVCPKKNGVLKPNNMQFELENNVQYEIGWLDDMKYFFKTMRWQVRNVSRVDIALDGSGFFKVWNLYQERKIQRIGGAQSQVFGKCSGGVEILSGFDIGSRSSDKWITCYNKTDELKTSNKDYIQNFWDRSGLNIKKVERMELKLRNECLKEINFDWKKMDDFEYLASIFRTYVDGGYIDQVDEATGEITRKNKRGLLQFVEASDDKNISRKKKIEFINWDFIGAEKLERFSTHQANEVWRMKVTCKNLCLLAESLKEKYPDRANHFLMEAHEIARNINCLPWLIDRFDNWIKEFSMMKLDYIPDYTIGKINDSMRRIELQPCNSVPVDLFFVRV
jgi:hypothetical protein